MDNYEAAHYRVKTGFTSGSVRPESGASCGFEAISGVNANRGTKKLKISVKWLNKSYGLSKYPETAVVVKRVC
ncbi:MAG: hypothetical protein VX438_11560, partial [Planctomycetota bacterium]|nr:hypothetical protein [Planctomycetota bacterium]